MGAPTHLMCGLIQQVFLVVPASLTMFESVVDQGQG
jgi:hypothetical protein